MSMTRCYSLMKCLLILFNIVFLLLGVAACGLSGWALWEGGLAAGVGGSAREGAAARAALVAVAAWGAALALGAGAALAGAAREAASLLAGGFALLALCGVAEAAAACWGAAHVPRLRQALAQRLHYAVRHEYGAQGVPTRFLDTIQTELKCCGAEGARDWQGSAWSRASGPGTGAAPAAPLDLSVTATTSYYYVPPSCCAVPAGSEEAEEACAAARRVPAASGSAAGLHAHACAPRVLHALETGARLPLGVAAGLLALHALTLLLALALCLRARPAPRYKA